MALDDLSKLQGSFGYKLCALYLLQRYRSSTLSDTLRMITEEFGEEWRDKATLDDVCIELELAGVGHAGTMRSVVLAGLGESIEEEYEDARDAAQWIAEQDRKLGAWAACACVREALKYVPSGESRPRIAIETAEACVRSEATEDQVMEARNAAYEVATLNLKADAASDAAYYATYAAYYAADSAITYTRAGPDAYGATAEAANAAAASGSEVWDKAVHSAELRRLVSVIARSLQTFPVLLTAPV